MSNIISWVNTVFDCKANIEEAAFFKQTLFVYKSPVKSIDKCDELEAIAEFRIWNCELTKQQLNCILSQMINLVALSMRTGSVELPEWLTSLTSLDIGHNRLTELPEWLGRLTALTYLNVSHTRITELPKPLFSLGLKLLHSALHCINICAVAVCYQPGPY